jgi:hypothetical protein
VQPDRDLVAHRARREKDGGFKPEQLRDSGAQRVHGRVGHQLLIADFGLGHCFAHRGRRKGLRVGK